MSEINYDCYSTNGENYYLYDDGDFLCSGVEVGDTIYEATVVSYVSTDFIDAESIVEEIGDSAFGEAGEYAEGWPNLSKSDMVELQKIIGNFIDSKCKPPKFWTVENVRDRILTEDDFSDYQNDIQAAIGGFTQVAVE
jgi:hypothetical protein